MLMKGIRYSTENPLSCNCIVLDPKALILGHLSHGLSWENGGAGQEDPVVYRARDLPKRMMLTPTANGAESMTLPLSSGTVGYSHRHNFAWLLECNELLQEAKGALEEGKNYTYAIEAVGEVIDAGGPVVGAALRHDCLCVRAAALLKV
jgi:WD and tetratricopeptide repeat-containing protein 1